MEEFTEVIVLVCDDHDNDLLSFLNKAAVHNISVHNSVNEILRRHLSLLKAVIFTQPFVNESALLSVRRRHPTVFIVAYIPSAVDNPLLRLSSFDAGVNMVTYDLHALLITLRKSVLFAKSKRGALSCPSCGLQGLTEDELWQHFPAFHINNENIKGPVTCPVCNKRTFDPLQVHVHEQHGPLVRRNGVSRAHEHAISYNFSLVVCKHPLTGKYLLCQEFANQGFWLPGGAVDAGESLTKAAVRECEEEAGITVNLKGILGIEYDARKGERVGDGEFGYIRMRVTFYAEPADLNQYPKTIPDYESAGACWCSAEEINDMIKLRGHEPRHWASYLSNGGIVYPLMLLTER